MRTFSGAMLVLALAPTFADAGDGVAPDWPRAKTYLVGKGPLGMRVHNGSFLVALSAEDTIGVFRLKNMSLMQKWPVGGMPVDLISVKDDWLVSLSSAGDAITLSRRGGFGLARAKVGRGLGHFAALPRKRALAVAGLDKVAAIFDLATGTIDQKLELIAGTGTPVAAPDKDILYIPDTTSSSLRAFDLAAKADISAVELCDTLHSLAISPDGALLAASCSSQAKVLLLAAADMSLKAEISENLGAAAGSLAISPDGNYLFVADEAGAKVTVIDLKSRTVVHHINTGKQPKVLRFLAGELFIANYGGGSVTRQAMPSGT